MRTFPSVIHKLLIVDDHQPTREWVRSALAGVTQNFCEASDGTEAVRQYSEEKPDWVFMDIDMEPMSGLTAAHLIRNDFPDARILLMSNHPAHVMEEAARAAGADLFLHKEDLWQAARILDPLKVC